MKPAVMAVCSIMLLAATPALSDEYELTVNVVGNGTVDPNGGIYTYSGRGGTIVSLLALPDPGHLLKSWTGTEDDSSTALTNTVVMDSNATVTVEFAPAIIVTKPAGSEIWSAKSTHSVEWSSCDVGTVHLLFSENDGLHWHIIAANIPDNGSFRWRIPEGFNSESCTLMAIPSTVDPNIVIIGSELFAIQSYYPGAEVESKWKSLGGDFDRTGLSDEYGPQFGCVKWQFETEDAVATSAVIGPDGRVHIACEGGKLHTLDADGNLLWTYDANSPLVGSPTIGPDGTLYAGGLGGKLYAIDIDGNLRWTHSTGGGVYSSPAVASDGSKVYVCSQDGRLYALGRDGSELWTFATKGVGAGEPGSIHASPAIGTDGSIYIGGLYDPNLYALDPNDGSVKWTCGFGKPFDPADPNTAIVGGWPFASPVVAPDGTIYQALLYNPNLYAIDPNTGAILRTTNLEPQCDWLDSCLRDNSLEECLAQEEVSQACGDWFGLVPRQWTAYTHTGCWTEPALGPDGTIYVSFDDPFLRAVDSNGVIKWARQLGEAGGFTLTVGNDGLIYAAGEDGILHVVDANGLEVARFESEGWLNFPVIASEYLLIVSDGKDDSLMMDDPANTLWAIGLEDCRDLSFDGSIDFNDIVLLAADWLACTDPNSPCNYRGAQKFLTADVDRDRYVRMPDLALIAEKWRGTEKVLGPPPPSNPRPFNGAEDVWPFNLTWTGGAKTVSYNVYFGTENPPPFVSSQTDPEFDPGPIEYSTTYYWRIEAIDPMGVRTGEMWSFTTKGPTR